MIDDLTQEQASLYVFDLLDAGEKAAFEAQMRFNPDLRLFVDELREAAASVAHASPLRELPVGFEARVLDAIRADEKVVPFKSSFAWLPWAIAAALAVACTLFYSELTTTRQALAEAKQMPEMKVAVLGSKIANSPQSNGVVVWDEKTQSGLVRLDQVPDLDPGKDYQLWVIDPNYKSPVSAGVIRADARHNAISFRATKPIKDPQKFAVSIENAGGVTEVGGPVVLLSN